MCFGESGGHREREKTRQRHACSVAERQVVVLGRESCPLAESYIDRAALEAGAEAENGSHSQRGEICRPRYSLHLLAMCGRDLGRFNASARHLLDDLGRKISENSGDARETSFQYQKILILVQRFN